MNKNNLERRAFNCELRTAPDSPATIVGYASVFSTLSVDLGGFKERIRPGAFRAALESPELDVVANIDHDNSRLLGRTKSQTMRIREDDHGLFVEIDLPDTQLGRDVAELMRRGDLSQMSFAFTVDSSGESWGHEDGVSVRDITNVSGLYDCSVVLFPAYTSTECALRSLEKHKQKPNLERAKRILRLVG